MECNPVIPPIPHSRADLVSIFGDVSEFVKTDGTLAQGWEADHIIRVRLPGSVPYAYGPARIQTITCHKLLEIVTRNLYAEIWEAGLQGALGPYGGGFSYRPNANNKALISLHAWGIAWDWDPATFPNGSTKKRDPNLVRLFAKWGFFAGENFKTTKDPMHFQYAVGI